MSRLFRRSLLAATAALLAVLPVGCTEEESDLGLGLANRGTLYNARTATLQANLAYSQRDSALATGGSDYNIVGNYSDPTFGTVGAEIYTQVALPSRTSTINFDSVTVDSVVLTLVRENLYPTDSVSYNFHFEVMQLAEAVSAEDSAYRAYSTLPVNPARRLFDSTLSIGQGDSVIRLRLGGDVATMLNYTGDNTGFVDFVKGLRLRLDPTRSDPGMLTLNFAATNTRLTAHYHYGNENDTSHYDFSLSHPFMHFSHDYAGTALGADSIDGSALLYLEPLGGYRLRVVFDSALAAFRTAHPRAVVHNAEMLLPVAEGDWGERPDRIVATYTPAATGREGYINDYLLGGVDGYYHAADSAYHLLLPRHVQGLLRSGIDLGTILNINSRRSSAARIVLNGNRADKPVCITLVYTE